MHTVRPTSFLHRTDTSLGMLVSDTWVLSVAAVLQCVPQVWLVMFHVHSVTECVWMVMFHVHG